MPTKHPFLAAAGATPVDLYKLVRDEISTHFPAESARIGLHLDNDAMPKSAALKEFLDCHPIPDDVKEQYSSAIMGIKNPSSSFVATVAIDDNAAQSIGFISMCHVQRLLDPAQAENLNWSSELLAVLAPRPNPPLIYPPQYQFLAEFYHELGNHLFTERNSQRLREAKITASSPEGLEIEMHGDVFAALCLAKRFGPKVLPLIAHHSNIRALEALSFTETKYYTSPGLDWAVSRIRNNPAILDGSYEDFYNLAAKIAARFAKDPEIKKLLRTEEKNEQGIERRMIDPEGAQKAFNSRGLKSIGTRYRKATSELTKLSLGINPFAHLDY